MTELFPPTMLDVLAILHPTSLGTGSPNRAAGDRLRGLDGTGLFEPIPVCDAEMAKACLAGLWLRFDFLDESHTISQDIDTPTGSFWHAIMHRREGDFGNSKYWWRRVGKHPALTGDPFAFTDAVEAFVTRGHGDEAALRAAQEREWQTLFDFCVRGATGR